MRRQKEPKPRFHSGWDTKRGRAASQAEWGMTDEEGYTDAEEEDEEEEVVVEEEEVQ